MQACWESVWTIIIVAKSADAVSTLRKFLPSDNSPPPCSLLERHVWKAITEFHPEPIIKSASFDAIFIYLCLKKTNR